MIFKIFIFNKLKLGQTETLYSLTQLDYILTNCKIVKRFFYQWESKLA